MKPFFWNSPLWVVAVLLEAEQLPGWWHWDTEPEVGGVTPPPRWRHNWACPVGRGRLGLPKSTRCATLRGARRKMLRDSQWEIYQLSAVRTRAAGYWTVRERTNKISHSKLKNMTCLKIDNNIIIMNIAIVIDRDLVRIKFDRLPRMLNRQIFSPTSNS